MNNEIVIFTDGDVNIEVQINPEEETVWLTQKQMGELFGVKQLVSILFILKIKQRKLIKYLCRRNQRI